LHLNFLNTIYYLPDNWIVAINLIEESPGSAETICQLTAGEGNLRASATEINRLIKVRVKRCGKSTPNFW
jgi:hypothetical protein